MNFDIEWFTTVPGLLISLGVLLLFVALISLILSTGKKKKELKGKDVDTEVAVNPENIDAPIVNADAVVVEQVYEQVPTEDVAVPALQNDNVVNTDNVVQDVKEVVSSDNVIEFDQVNNESSTNVVVPEVIPSITGADSINYDEVKQNTINNEGGSSVNSSDVVIPVVDNSASPKPIYGGASPVAPSFVQEEARPIYGGADPLENTTTIKPISHQEIYHGAQPTENINSVITPIIEKNPEEVSSVVQSVPTVECEPVVEEQVSQVDTSSSEDDVELLEL